MGEWGKWWGGRGKDTQVKCESCGRGVPKHKAVEIVSRAKLERGVYEMAEYVSMASTKAYLCISCAKHRKIVKDGVHTTEKEKKLKKKAKSEKEMKKVMQKVKDMEREEKKTTKKTEKDDTQSK